MSKTQSIRAPWSISVVVPCYNADRELARCLAALRAQDLSALEIIVVDDASTEGDAGAIAEQFAARFLRLDVNEGPAVARNRGVALASGDYIVFIDADVVVHEDTVRLAAETLAGDRSLGACFGSYDEAPADPGFLSQFRNLYHRWTHQSGSENASTFWTGCGAVTRTAFDAAGGFSRALSRMGMEDIDLGYRLRDVGYRIRLLKTMECQHLKAWRLMSMIRTDIFHRGVPWMLLLLAREEQTQDLNVNSTARYATLAGGIAPAFLLAGFWHPAFFVPAFIAAMAIPALQWDFLRYVKTLRGTLFALRCMPALWVFFACCAISIPLALARQWSGRGLQGKLARPPMAGSA